MARNVPSTDAAPHMSNFIWSMSRPGLSEMPPVSKVMPLPTSTHGFGLLALRLHVLEDDEARRLVAAVGDRQERAHPELLDLLALEHLDLDVGEFVAELLRALAKVRRRADVAGQVAEVAREVHAVRDREPLRGGLLAGRRDRSAAAPTA